MKFTIKQKNFLPHQQKWWDLENRYKLLIGGYGSGKTYIGALRSIYLSYINSPIPVMYISPSYKMAKRTIIITLKEVLNRAGIDYTHNKTDHEFKIHNWDGVIWVGSGDDPDSLRGPNIAAAGIDEPFIQKREVFDQMIARVRHPESVQSEIFLTGTPEELNWGHSLATSEDIDIGVVIGSTLENTHLPDEYKESLLSTYSKEQIDAYVYGKFVNLTQGRVYKEFDREKHVRHRDDLNGWDIGIGQDYNVDAMTSIIFRYNKNEIHIFDEIRLKNSGTFDMAEILHEKYPGAKVFPDATGSARRSSASQSDHDIMRQKGFSLLCEKSNPPVRDTVNAVNKAFREGRITMENCPNLITDMERNVWRNGDIDKRDQELTHAGDCLRYSVNYLFPIVQQQIRYQTW